jgi:hypothetical protein
MTEQELREQIMLAAFEDELEKIAAGGKTREAIGRGLVRLKQRISKATKPGKPLDFVGRAYAPVRRGAEQQSRTHRALEVMSGRLADRGQ